MGGPQGGWAASSFACCFLMMCDETFYDPRSGVYTVEAFHDHGQREFGGYGSLVLWHAYPRIGVDDRNQFDFYRFNTVTFRRRVEFKRFAIDVTPVTNAAYFTEFLGF